MSILSFLFVGLLAGWFASLLIIGHGLGIVGDIAIGVIGAFIGGFFFDFLGIDSYGFIGALITSLVGAILFLALIFLYRKPRQIMVRNRIERN